jgi:hypothetical protein
VLRLGEGGGGYGGTGKNKPTRGGLLHIREVDFIFRNTKVL